MTYRIRVAEPCLTGNERRYVMDCLDSSWISSRGKYIEQFEQMVAEFCGAQYAIAANNGTTALHLALVALGVEPGDEVLVPTLSYVASANAVRYCGATPVFVDATAPHLTMNPGDLEAKITPRTRGILTVPLYGHPVDLDPILAVAQQHNLFVMEDAAEALGARYKDRPTGALGHCASFSFFGNKIITTGEGGMVVTQDRELADRLRFLRGQAVSPTRQYWHTDVGYNYRMTNICAAIGCAQMERIEFHLQRRREIADWYFQALEPHADWFVLPHAADWAQHCYWMFTIILRDELPADRDALIRSMEQRGIETRPVFYPIHWMPPYAGSPGAFPIADRCAPRGMSLPTHAGLTRQDVDTVCQELLVCVRELATSTQVPWSRAA